jgi:hypothetical protein
MSHSLIPHHFSSAVDQDLCALLFSNVRETVDNAGKRLVCGPTKLTEKETVACVWNLLTTGKDLVNCDADVDVG